MPNPKKLTDLQRNWNIAKQYVKGSPSLPNILKALKLQEKIGLLEMQLMLGTNPILYRKLAQELSKAKQEYNILKLLSILQVYSPQDETILKKYDSFPKMFGKVFKDLKPLIVKDSKGNNWFKFAIPLNMLLMELSYKQGGIL